MFHSREVAWLSLSLPDEVRAPVAGSVRGCSAGPRPAEVGQRPGKESPHRPWEAVSEGTAVPVGALGWAEPGLCVRAATFGFTPNLWVFFNRA